MEDITKHIAIIGAGISGLALGIILKRYNIPCVIFEKSEKISEYGAGISLSPNGLKVLKDLDVFKKIKTHSCNPRNGIFFSRSNQIANTSINVITTSRDLLHKILYEKYISMDGNILFNHELSDLSLDNKYLNFTNKKIYKPFHTVGADGIRSKCRQKINNKENLIYSGYSVWRSILFGNQDDIIFHLDKNFHIVSYPISKNKISFVAVIKKSEVLKESWKLKGSLDDLSKELPSKLMQRYFLNNNNSSEVFKWGVFIRPEIKDLYIDNLTLIGDAAHPIVPFLGQGACLALEDAYTFGNLINLYKNDIIKSQIKYNHIRLKRVTKIHKMSLNQAKFNHLGNPLAIFFRNSLMKYTNIISLRTRGIWNYDITKVLDI